LIKTAHEETRQLIVFDLDRTLLNKHSQLSPFTLQTLRKMDSRGLLYTIATGRSFLSAADIISKHPFRLPQIFTNGVVTWCPKSHSLSFDNCLSLDETQSALNVMQSKQANPFINAMDKDGKRVVFYGSYKNKIEQDLLQRFSRANNTLMRPIEALNTQFKITNISMIGPSQQIVSAHENINELNQLIAYSGQAIEDSEFSWIDVHHHNANKGAAITRLKSEMNIDSIICFGDGDNDLSMFKIANECYAPENANEENKKAATAIIGHHDEDGVAQFLVDRFSL